MLNYKSANRCGGFDMRPLRVECLVAFSGPLIGVAGLGMFSLSASGISVAPEFDTGFCNAVDVTADVVSGVNTGVTAGITVGVAIGVTRMCCLPADHLAISLMHNV